MKEEQAPITDLPSQSVLTVAHIVYALHAIAIILGISGAPTIIGSFIGSLPSILAVILLAFILTPIIEIAVFIVNVNFGVVERLTEVRIDGSVRRWGIAVDDVRRG